MHGEDASRDSHRVHTFVYTQVCTYIGETRFLTNTSVAAESTLSSRRLRQPGVERCTTLHSSFAYNTPLVGGTEGPVAFVDEIRRERTNAPAAAALSFSFSSPYASHTVSPLPYSDRLTLLAFSCLFASLRRDGVSASASVVEVGSPCCSLRPHVLLSLVAFSRRP